MENRFKLAFAVLAMATIVWGVVFYYTLREYNTYVEGLSELEREWGLWTPWWRWNDMPYVIIAGVGLLSAWLFVIITYHQKMKSQS